jgi:hypothetical protein
MGKELERTGRGRPKGSPNRTSAQVRELLSAALSKCEETLFEDIQSLKPSERAKFLTAILPYLAPKLQAQTDTDGKDVNPPISVQLKGATLQNLQELADMEMPETEPENDPETELPIF